MSDTETPTTRETHAALSDHIAAFNSHSTERLLAGFTRDALWSTGTDVFRGHGALRTLFDEGLWTLDPVLEVKSLITQDRLGAAELREVLTVDGERREFAIAAFFEVADGLIRATKVYREGTADIEQPSEAPGRPNLAME